MIKLRNNLYVGGYRDVASDRELRAQGITAVLNVAFELNDPEMDPLLIKTLKVGLMDADLNEKYMKRLAVDAAKRLLEGGDILFVHCAAGQSRSVYVCTMAIAELEGKNHHDVWNEIKKLHPFAMFGPLFHGENARYYPDAELVEKKV